jgi:hypothetical protein
MTGVEILTSSQVAYEWAFNWTAFWIVGIVAFVIVTAIGIWQWLGGYCSFGIVPALIFVGMAAGVAFGALWGSFLSQPAEYTTEYKVIISDEVSMNEFNEKYEIIERDGKIYTVRERVYGKGEGE